MSDTDQSSHMPPLGVGKILSETFQIFFQNIVVIMILGFIAAYVGYLITYAGAVRSLSDPGFTDGASTLATVGLLPIVVNLLLSSIVTGLVILIAYDAKVGRSSGLAQHFKTVLPSIPMIIAVTLVSMILTVLGAFLILIGMLWVYAVFYVLVPAVLIDRAGFGSLRRSADLTREYRWPIVGILLVLSLVGLGLQLLIMPIVGTSFSLEPAGAFGITGIISSVFSAVSYGLLAVSVALVYARLREVKEGVNVDSLVEIFQ